MKHEKIVFCVLTFVARPIISLCKRQSLWRDFKGGAPYALTLNQKLNFPRLGNAFCQSVPSFKTVHRTVLKFTLCKGLNAKEFRRLRTATKGSAFGNRKPLKRLDRNFNRGLLFKLVQIGRSPYNITLQKFRIAEFL